jgi:PEP-CTERM motif
MDTFDQFEYQMHESALRGTLRRNSMRNSIKLCTLATVLVASATFASASTIAIISGAGSAASHSNGALEYLGYFPTSGSGYPSGPLTYNTTFSNSAPVVATPTTVNIGTGGVWSGPILTSSWVSFANTAPGQLAPTNGDYVYETTIDTTGLGGGTWAGTFALLADDTVSVFLNGTNVTNEFVTSPGVGSNVKCADLAPTCTGLGLVVPFGTVLGPNFNANGLNTVVFVVQQTGNASEGLDFAGVISQTTVPEPNTLLMLGTGMLGTAGAMFRRMRK